MTRRPSDARGSVVVLAIVAGLLGDGEVSVVAGLHAARTIAPEIPQHAKSVARRRILGINGWGRRVGGTSPR